jgi:glycosyltransferase involved in cell wall biosynthesis
MIESLACGTPVIAWKNGAVPEVLADGGTGFVVNTIEEAVKAVDDVASLSRHACRQVFEQRFDATRMARDYLKVYSRLIHKPARHYGISAHADSGDMETTVWPTLSIS